MKFIPTTASQLARIKTRARELRPRYASLGHSRDAASKEAGYDSYHHAHSCATGAVDTKQNDEPLSPKNAELVNFAVEHLPAILRRDPVYNYDDLGFQLRIANSGGLDLMRRHIQGVHVEGGLGYFWAAMRDASASLATSGHIQSIEYHDAEQIALIGEIWSALYLNDRWFPFMSDSAVLRVRRHYEAGMYTPGLERGDVRELEKLIAFIDALIAAPSNQAAIRVIVTQGNRLMPRSMNIDLHTGLEDYAEPSSYWSRVASTVSMEIASAVANLPLGILRKYLESGRLGPMPFFTMHVPVDRLLRDMYLQAARSRAEE